MSKRSHKRKFTLKTFIDLFAGIGGFRFALGQLGLKCLLSSEIDPWARIVYRLNHGDYPRGDVQKLGTRDVPKADVLCAGFPCQSWSLAGNMLGFDDPRGLLFFEILRIARLCDPKIIFLENVPALLNAKHRRALATIIQRLERLGYHVFYKLLNASGFGVPQSRERIYLVCFRNDLGITKFDFPQPTNEPVRLLDILEPETKEHVQRHIVNDLEGVVWKKDIPALERKISGNRTSFLHVGHIRDNTQGDRIYSPLGHAITLTASRGCASGMYLINGKVRTLTPRECCRLMGFSDSFKILPAVREAGKQFGNGVVVPVVRRVFEKVLQTLG